MTKEISKLDISAMDVGSIKQAINVLANVKADYLVIDLIAKLKNELTKRGVKFDDNF